MPRGASAGKLHSRPLAEALTDSDKETPHQRYIRIQSDLDSLKLIGGLIISNLRVATS